MESIMDIDLKNPSRQPSLPRRRGAWRSRRRGCRRGAAAVEMAIVLLPFLLFIFGIFEFGRFVMIRNLVENATRDGCRLAAVNTDVNENSQNARTADIEQRVLDKLAGQSLSNLEIWVYPTNSEGRKLLGDWTTANYQQGIAVQVTGKYKPVLTGWIFSSSVTIDCKCIMNSEGQ